MRQGGCTWLLGDDAADPRTASGVEVEQASATMAARTRRKIFLISTQVSLMHGGTPKAHLHLFSSLFGDKTHIRFPELIRACVAPAPCC